MKRNILSTLFTILTMYVGAQANLSGIVINEILVDPTATTGYDTDGSGTVQAEDEFIELYNTSVSAVDVSGWQFWDKGKNDWFTLPGTVDDGTTILQPSASLLVVIDVQSGGSLPAVSGNDLAFDANRGSFSIFNNGGDNITLYDPGANEFIQLKYNGAADDDPTTDYAAAGFSSTATRNGTLENWGNANEGGAVGRVPDGSTNIVAATDGNATPASSNASLPVELIFFSANIEQEKVVLTWQTAAELNNAYFHIERSQDGETFEMIGKRLGAGSTLEPQFYEFTDETSFEHLNYYRLKQVDFDGDFEYHNIIAVDRSLVKTAPKLYPNPIKDYLHIELNDTWQPTVDIQIIDFTGRIVFESIISKSEKRLDFSDLSNGTYFIKISDEKHTEVYRFLKVE